MRTRKRAETLYEETAACKWHKVFGFVHSPLCVLETAAKAAFWGCGAYALLSVAKYMDVTTFVMMLQLKMMGIG